MNHSHQPNASMIVSVNASIRGNSLVIVESCIFVLLNIASLVGNSLVCLAFYRNSLLRTATNYFFLSLALTDLSMVVLVMPFHTALTLTAYGIANNFSCKLYYFCVTVLAGVSLWTMMILSINRYFRVAVQPAFYEKLFSKKRSVAMAVYVWVVAIAMVLVLVFSTKKQPQKNTVEPVATCIQFLQKIGSPKLYYVISVIYIAVPSITIVSCYIRIYQTIRQHKTAAAQSSQGKRSSYGVEEAKITRMLTVVVVGFYLCWLPQVINCVLLAVDLIEETSIKYRIFYLSFPIFTSSVINPIIYATTSQSFRSEFLKTVRRQP